MDNDIVSTSRENLEKFINLIRLWELHRLATYVKILDALYSLAVRDSRLVETFKPTLSPRYNYISRTDGKYSPRMSYIKDYIIVLSELYELGRDN